MTLGIVGLGKMGQALASRVHKAGLSVAGYDVNEYARKEAGKEGIVVVPSLSALAHHADIIWLMVPAGDIVDQVIAELLVYIKKGTLIIDGGNSKFSDSVVRAEKLKRYDIGYLDCGTSGGVHGKEFGFCLMVGGDKKEYDRAQPFFHAMAAPDGVAHVGPAGAGHYVKMIHNGIEYGLLEAYAEGFHLLREGNYPNLDMKEISNLWCHGAIIRSWLLELTRDIYKGNPPFEKISGEIGEGGTGKWTVDTAHENKIPVPVIEASLDVRAWSRKTGGNYATKLIALMRNAFGGHSIKEKK